MRKLANKIFLDYGFYIFLGIILSIGIVTSCTSPKQEDTKLVQCIELKFNNDEFKKDVILYSGTYCSDNICISLWRDYGEEFEFESLLINSNDITLSSNEIDRINELIVVYEDRKDKEDRDDFTKKCKPKGYNIN